MSTYYALDPQSALAYVRQSPIKAAIFGDHDDLQSVDLAEGNVNLIFRVYRAAAPGTSVLVKQALPHSRRYPDFKMPLERSRLEYDVLQLEGKYCPGRVPQVYHYDEAMFVSLMEDLNQHLIMRDGLARQIVYPRVAEHIGLFMARTLFYTSDLYLPSAEKKALVSRYENSVMRKTQEDLVFTQPFLPNSNNRWTPQLEAEVQRIYGDDTLRSEVFWLKEAYMTRAQALLHNDLHTGSIMLNEQDTRVIDPEFAFYGPIGHDIGSYFGNLVLSYAAQEYHAGDAQTRAAYRRWIADTIVETWQIFEREFVRLWETDGSAEWPSPRFRAQYVAQLLQDTAGFSATEMIRRLIGMAHVPDLDSIPDDETRAEAERLALGVAQSWLLNRRGVQSIGALVDMLRAATPAPASV